MSEACDRCGPAVRAGYRVERCGELYLCRHCASRHWAALSAQGWTQPVYYDAGLGAMLRVGSIPTTIVLNREGQIVSRMAGFIPGRFVDMLTSRIEESLHDQ